MPQRETHHPAVIPNIYDPSMRPEIEDEEIPKTSKKIMSKSAIKWIIVIAIIVILIMIVTVILLVRKKGNKQQTNYIPKPMTREIPQYRPQKSKEELAKMADELNVEPQKINTPDQVELDPVVVSNLPTAILTEISEEDTVENNDSEIEEDLNSQSEAQSNTESELDEEAEILQHVEKGKCSYRLPKSGNLCNCKIKKGSDYDRCGKHLDL